MRLILLCSWLSWALAVVAQFQSFSPLGPNGLTYSIHIPEATASSGTGPIYFQMNSTRRIEWFALGQGDRMAGSNMFVVYTSGNNVTVSPRSGVGHTQPLYNPAAQITVMNGSGVHGVMITANIKCDTCVHWGVASMSPNSSSSSWIWGVRYGAPLKSQSLSANLLEHDVMGIHTVDLKNATGRTSVNPFDDLVSTSMDADADYPFPTAEFRAKKIAHAVLMIFAFVLLFPMAALVLPLSSSSNALYIHGGLQLCALAISITGLALGVSMGQQMHNLIHYHMIIGIVVISTLVLFQPAMGLLQHRFFRKTGGKGPFAYMHRWFGRIMIMLGVVNVGLGFKFTGVGDPDAPQGAVIAVSVLIGVIAVIYVLSVGFYLHRKSHHNKPTVHITYDEGIQVIRQFIYYASKHPVEDIQAFTRQAVPSPHWVRTESISIPEGHLSTAGDILCKQLGPKGIIRVGGKKWWQWRGPSEELKGEWIEMRSHYNANKKAKSRCSKIMLYVHGGAYFFGSVDTHRYMLQRHARKLKGRVFAPHYRLAPQYPFPCGLQDCMASYLWLLETYDPKEIILAGDSAGGGMVLSLLVMMRDQGIALPAGAILISPWVDLTHSFPSIVEDNPGDYIPPAGFRYKPSTAWPPPNADELLKIKELSHKKTVTVKDVEETVPAANSKSEETAVRGYTLHDKVAPGAGPAYPGQQENCDPQTIQGEPDNIHVVMDGKTIEIKDQIQMYTTNQLISHPLVSPVLQPSLGGLPPLQILTGGGEMLRDEQFYIAHKAANPTAYPPSDVYLDEHDPDREILNKYEPTYVQFQIWDNLCHVAPTLSFTRPAKYMFRAISQFGSWALARAQDTEVEIVDEELLSPISSSASDSSSEGHIPHSGKQRTDTGMSFVGRAGDPLPSFYQHMIRERVDKRGRTYPLDPPSSYPVLEIPPEQVGAINPVLIRKWLDSKYEWDVRFGKEKLKIQNRRIREMSHGLQDFEGEYPSPSSLAARRAAPGVLPKRHAKKNYGLMLWSGWGSKHDERTMEREKEAEKSGRPSTRTSIDAGQAGQWSSQPAKNSHRNSLKKKSAAAKSTSSGTPGLTWDVASEKKPTSGDRSSADPDSSSVRAVSEKSMGPILILPGVDNRKFTEENASTRALFHAAGTLPMTSDASLPYLRGRPSSIGGSVAGRSEFMSDAGEDASTIGGGEGVAGVSYDAASTRAVLSAKGVIRPLNNGDSGRLSVDTASGHLVQKDVNGNTGAAASHRPEMPDREEFKTANETL
ncbi:Alpha/beta hydrolase fold-3 [Penicillium herquei]|nr:Alpha/beta hydrolase fold-3 [Penicillium herquei]